MKQHGQVTHIGHIGVWPDINHFPKADRRISRLRTKSTDRSGPDQLFDILNPLSHWFFLRSLLDLECCAFPT